MGTQIVLTITSLLLLINLLRAVRAVKRNRTNRSTEAVAKLNILADGKEESDQGLLYK